MAVKVSILVVTGIAVFSLCLPTSGFAQGETAVPFLIFSASPDGNGMGGISGSRVSDDAMASIANPGQLGLQSLHQFMSSGFFLPTTDWSPALGVNKITYSATAVNVGLNLQRVVAIPLPVSFGFGYSYINHDLGDYYIYNGLGQPQAMFTANEHSSDYTLGIGLDYYIKLGLGYTTKSVVSSLVPYSIQGTGRQGVADFSTYDVGLITQIPVIDIAYRAFGPLPRLLPKVDPLLDLTLGYSRNNLGNTRVVYIDASQADPLPRTVTAGLNVKLGFVSHVLESDWELISFMIGREAEDLLVRRYPAPTDSLGNEIGPAPPWQYLNGTGDIRFFDNLVLGEWGGNIELRKGWQLNIAELFYLRGGSYLGMGGQDYTTTGFSFRLGGILKFLEWFSPPVASNRFVGFVAQHFDIQYNWSEYRAADPTFPVDKTTYSGMNIIIK